MTYAVIAAVAVSLGTLFQLFQRHIDGQPLIAAEFRRVVPWNFLAPLVLLAPLLLAIAANLGIGVDEPLPGELEPTLTVGVTTSLVSSAGFPAASQFAGATAAGSAVSEAFYGVDTSSLIAAMWGQATLTLTLGAVCFALLILAFGATRLDLGLPATWPQFIADVQLGAMLWAASLVPIYALMWLLITIVKPTDQHPLIERLIDHHSFGMMAAAAFTAVIAAPFYEEVAFRLVLQGWLERVALPSPPPLDPPLGPGEAFERQGIRWKSELLYAPVVTQWFPVMVSSTLFGLAHWGHGVSPIPLIFLGVILGYGYQRTHRIVPCIVCHMMFNGFTFILMGLQFAGRN